MTRRGPGRARPKSFARAGRTLGSESRTCIRPDPPCEPELGLLGVRAAGTGEWSTRLTRFDSVQGAASLPCRRVDPPR